MKRSAPVSKYESRLHSQRSPARKRCRLSCHPKGITNEDCVEKCSLHGDIGDNAKESGFPLIYIFWLVLFLCSNYCNRRYLERTYDIDIWQYVFIPASQMRTPFQIANKAITEFYGLFTRIEKKQMLSFLKSNNFFVKEFQERIRSATEKDLYLYLKSLDECSSLPVESIKLIAELSDGGGFIEENFLELLSSNPSGWDEDDIGKFMKIMGINKSTQLVFESDPINMRFENLSMINQDDIYKLIEIAKLDVKAQIVKYEQDLQDFYGGKCDDDFPSDAAERQYVRPQIIDKEQVSLALHWFDYLRFHAHGYQV